MNDQNTGDHPLKATAVGDSVEASNAQIVPPFMRPNRDTLVRRVRIADLTSREGTSVEEPSYIRDLLASAPLPRR